MLVAAAALVHALLAVFDVDWLASCVIHHSRSQLGEELVVLPTLVHATRGKPGVFVEIGAFTGLELSNTFALERCFNWTGVLIEANPHNFEKLKNCGRKATFVHSAVCDSEGTARMTTDGAMMSGEFGAMSQEYLRRWGRRNGAFANRSVDVPCKPLPAILAAAVRPSPTVAQPALACATPAAPHLFRGSERGAIARSRRATAAPTF